MINVRDERKRYMLCNSCQSGDQVKSIEIGMDGNHTSSFRLCRSCMLTLQAKLPTEDDYNSKYRVKIVKSIEQGSDSIEQLIGQEFDVHSEEDHGVVCVVSEGNLLELAPEEYEII